MGELIMSDEIVVRHSETTLLQTASLSRRLVAVLIDAVICALPALLLSGVLSFIAAPLIWFLYGPVFESSPLKATIGKKLMGVTVTSMDGNRLSFGAAALRNAVKTVSTAFLFLPWFLALFTDKKQAVHDLVTDSRVIYGRVELPVFDTWWQHLRGLLNGTPLVNSTSSKLSALERLQALYERGALTQEEFENEKKKIL